MPVTACEFESRPGHSESGLQISATHFSFPSRPHHDRKSVVCPKNFRIQGSFLKISDKHLKTFMQNFSITNCHSTRQEVTISNY